MALKITLRPGERMIIGGAVISNGEKSSEFIVENRVPVLREKDILSESGADTPCRRIYFVIQLMYVDNPNLPEHHRHYWKLVRDVVQAAPSTVPLVDGISEEIVNGRYYQALKKTKKLIAYEKELMDNARKSLTGI
ncbi:MAG: flagellar biosynthesis repressor FlbT [Desulfococcaceae bacterium]|jgi:flagellar protein FlbT|nr:flagellar biosynthesis repressor FlbT [Desulfococcaceae bacterium]